MAVPAADERRDNVPTALSSFVGRGRELAHVRALLDGTRLVTLAGPGGVGKTRLARELAAALATGAAPNTGPSPNTGDVPAAGHGVAPSDFPGGVWWVELAPLPPGTDPEPSVAAALGVRQSPGTGPAHALVTALGARRTLVVLDNCEHVIDGAATLADRLLRGCPGLTLVVTSREALGVEGEVVRPVPPLMHPPVGARADAAASAAALAEYDAVRLFVARARAVQPGFTLTARNAAAVAAITARLDGLPLALELAAAQVAALGVDALATRLDDVFAVLARGRRTALPRHKTLRALLDWSYHLLDEPERTLLRRLSVFHGAATLEAVAEVCGDGDGDARVVAALGRLVEQSLVEVRDTRGEVRYGLLETVRQYGAALLARTPDEGRTRDRHLRWAAALVTATEPRLITRDRWREVDVLQHHSEDLRAAVRWAAEGAPSAAPSAAPSDAATVDRAVAALTVVGGLAFFWLSTGAWEDAGDLHAAARTAAARAGLVLDGDAAATAADAARAPTAVRTAVGRAFYSGALLKLLTGRLDEALHEATRALAWWEAERDDPAATDARRREAERMRTHFHLLRLECHLSRGNLAAAYAEAAPAAAAARASGDAYAATVTEARVAAVDAAAGESARAAATCERILPWWRASGDSVVLSITLHLAADLARARGDLAGAAAHAREAVDVLGAGRDLWSLSRLLELLAAVCMAAVQTGQTADPADSATTAARLLGAAEGVRTRAGAAHIRLDQPVQAATRAAAEARLGAAAFAAAWNEGERMETAAAIALAHHVTDAVVAPAAVPAPVLDLPVTAREPVAAPAPAPARAAAPVSAAAAPVSTIEVLAFGPLAVGRGGAWLGPADLTPAKARELLLYLALHPARTKEQIALALWPDASPAQVRSAFHFTMHQLRRILGHKDAVTFTGGAYALVRPAPHDASAGAGAGAAVVSDVEAVLAAADAARRADRAAEQGAARGPDALAAVGVAGDTLAAWRAALDRARRGPLGDGAEAGEWLVAPQARVQAAWGDGMEALARLHARRGAPADAAGTLEALLAADPLREAAHRALMACYAAAGEPARALAHYRALGALLAREVGTAPTRETQALAEAIRRGAV